MSNATALRTVLDHVREHPDEWRQEEWSNCFAGQTLRALVGATNTASGCHCCGGLVVDGEALYGSNIGVRAAQLLDLTPHQAHRLFNGANSLSRLANMIEEFTGEEKAPPEMALSA